MLQLIAFIIAVAVIAIIENYGGFFIEEEDNEK